MDDTNPLLIPPELQDPPLPRIIGGDTAEPRKNTCRDWNWTYFVFSYI